MAFGNSRSGIIAAVSATAITAVLVYFGTGLFPLWPLMWFAPIPVLLFASRSSWWGTALVTFAAWFLGGLNLWHFFNHSLRLPPAVQAVIYILPALLFMACVLFFRALITRGAWWSAAFAFPSAWVSLEYLVNLISPHGTGGNLSYSQLNFLPFLQLASITGPWGMSFLLMLFSSSTVVAIESRRAAPSRAWHVMAACWGLIALVLVFGGLRLSSSQTGQRVKVGLVASDQSQNADVAHAGQDAQRLFSAYGDAAADLASRGAQVIVLPEKLAVVVASDSGKTDAFFQSLADKTEAMLVVGMVYVDGPVKYNRARIYTPHAPVESYDKHHMLPPFESNLKPGTTIFTTSKPSGTWGVAICKDMDFTPLSRQYGNAGAGLMLVPAWDFVHDRFQHGHIAVMRGVEDGFGIVRAAKQGYLTVSDDRGRLLAETRSNSAPFATLLADVPEGHERTIYSWLGDWFGWAAMVIFAFTLVQLFRTQAAPAPKSS